MNQGASDPCPSEDAVDAFAAGRLPVNEQRALEPHLDRCTSCKRRLLRLVTRTSARELEPEVTTRLPEQPATPTARALHGRRVGRYAILEDVGAGAMGVVYAAYDTLLDRKVALKFLTPRAVTEPPAARVLAEAAAMARLSHPNVVTVHDVGEHEGLTYLSMEFVDGVNLATWRKQQPRTIKHIVQVMAAAARGLAAAHAAGVIHRDVKPQNILVSGARVLVTDFGVAMRAGVDGEGTVAGTPAYMAPEQFRGEAVDARTDVFGFCATLYELLHDERAFAGSSRQEVQAQVMAGQVRPATSNTRVPGRLQRLVLQGLDPDPARRPSNMNQLADQLLTDPAVRRRNLALVGGAGAMVLLAFWGGGYLTGTPERQCRRGAEQIAEVWNADQRARLEQKYASAGLGSSWPLLERRLQEYAGRWRQVYGETCGATYGKRVMSDEVFDHRVQCLRGQQGTVAALLAALPTATAEQLVQAAGAALPVVGDCELTTRPETKPRPTDPASRQQMAAIEKDIAECEAAQNLGDYSRAVEAGRRAIAAARKLGFEPLLAAALVRLGSVEKARGAFTDAPGAGLSEAAKLLPEAYAVAEVGRDDRHRLVAASEQVKVEMQLSRLPEARRWVSHAEALLTRLGTPPSEASLLWAHVGSLHFFAGETPQARTYFMKAAAAARKVVPVDHRRLTLAEGGLCAGLNDLEQLVPCFRKVLELAKAAYGPDHPEVGTFYGNLGTVLLSQPGHHAEARALMRKTLQLWRGHKGPYVIKQMVNLAIAEEEAQNPAEARRFLEAALALQPKGAIRADALERYGIFLANHVDVQAGLARAREGLAEFIAIGGATHDDSVSARTTVAALLRDSGRLEEALHELDDMSDQCRKAGVVTYSVVQMQSTRTGVLALLKRPEAALRNGQETIRLLRQLGSHERELGLTFHGMALANLQLGRVDEAQAQLEKALKLRTEGAQEVVTSNTLADIQFTLAKVLAGKGEDEARACDLARKAAGLYRRCLRKRPQQLEADRWLARRSCAAQT